MMTYGTPFTYMRPEAGVIEDSDRPGVFGVFG